MKGEGDGMTSEDESSLALAAPSVCLTFVYPGENGGWLRNSVQLSSVQFNFICVTPHYYKVVPGHFTRQVAVVQTPAASWEETCLLKRQQPRVDPDFLIEGMRLKPAQSFCGSESLLVSAKTSCGAKFLKKLGTQELKQKVLVED